MKIGLVLISLIVTANVFSQVPVSTVKCETDVKGGKYKWASISDLPDSPESVSGFVLVKPKQINREFLMKMAKRLKAEYCNAEELRIAIFDQANYASPTSFQDLIDSNGKTILIRGFYSFDRKSGEENLEFSTALGKPTTEIQIDLAITDASQEEFRQ